ncbi:MAG: MFS transporter, partial [Gemmatimonadota bacterium]|nr:MFS transporter [Gemmatimonadota bacterium]
MHRTTAYVGHFLARFERNVKLYMACAALIGFSVFGIYSVLFNLYLLRMDYDIDLIGHFNAAGLLSFALFSPIAGNWARRAGYRRTLVGGMSLMVMGYLLMSLAGFFFGPLRTGWITAVQVVINCGFATYTVNSSPFLMSATAADNRSLVFSLRGAVWPLFGFAGSALGGTLPQAFARLTGYDGLVPYQCSLLVASLVLAPSLFL